MRRLVPALLTLALASAVNAEDIPLPQRKPRDAKGQPILSTTPGPAKSAKPAAADGKAEKAVKADKSAPKLASPAQPADKPSDKADAKAPPGAASGWPKTLPEAKAEAEAKAKPETVPTAWTEAEIADAKAMCKSILDKIDAVAIPEAPFRQGECGARAPMRLISVGRKPEVVLNPPAVVSCGMIGALHTWLTKDLQPLARRHLGSEIIKVESMSDYSCRNAYGRTKTRLSEHGRANALDIRGFMTAKGEGAVVLSGWGETEREIAARALAAKMEREIAARALAAKQAEERANAIRAAAEAAAAAHAGKDADKAKSGLSPPAATGSVNPAVPKIRRSIVEGAPAGGKTPSLGIAPSQLGGPKVPPPEPPARMKKFLRAAHAAACKIFGTTLGPEANNAHRNHFHIDMAPRERSKFCE